MRDRNEAQQRDALRWTISIGLAEDLADIFRMGFGLAYTAFQDDLIVHRWCGRSL